MDAERSRYLARMSSKADNTSNTSNTDLCSVVANFVAVGYVLAELELLLLLLLLLLLSNTATLNEIKDKMTLIAYRAREIH